MVPALRRVRSGTILVMSDPSGSDSLFCEYDLKPIDEDRLLRPLDGPIGGADGHRYCSVVQA